MQQVATQTQSGISRKAKRQGRLRNGVREGAVIRVYRQHQMRFGRAKEVITGFGIGPNVTVQYLDLGQEMGQVFGNVVQPVTSGWIHDMKDRFSDIQDIFEPAVNGPVAARQNDNLRKLRNGVTSGSLVRIYREHQMRFGRVLRVNRPMLPTSSNVAIEYLDGDREEDRVMGSIVQPVTKDWVQDLEARLDAVSKLMAAERAMQIKKTGTPIY